jgi:Bacterial PH domain
VDDGPRAIKMADDPLGARLHGEERVLWRGQPDVAAYSLRGAWYLIPFSILWCAFAIFWEASVLLSGKHNWFFVLWGIPFVALGLYMVFGRLLVARAEARRTHFAITDRRVLIVSGAVRQRVVEIALDDLPPAQLEVDGSGLGTITFRRSRSGRRRSRQ